MAQKTGLSVSALDSECIAGKPVVPVESISRAGFNADAIIYRETNALLRSKISFRGLDRDMAQQHLNLLQLAARYLAESRTCAA